MFPRRPIKYKETPNVGKALDLRGARVIYRVKQITHRAMTTNKRDQVIVTMLASKLQTKQEQTYKKYNSKSIKKGKDTRAHRSLRLLLELKRRLDPILGSQQGFACASTTKLEPSNVENFKKSVVCLNSTVSILI
jgi:hypothetical protein